MELWRERVDLGELRRPFAAREATRATGAEPLAILAAEGTTLHREWLRLLGAVLLLLRCDPIKVVLVGHLVGHDARRVVLGGMCVGPHDRVAGVGAEVVRRVRAAQDEAEVDEAEGRVERELPPKLCVGLVRLVWVRVRVRVRARARARARARVGVGVRVRVRVRVRLVRRSLEAVKRLGGGVE